MPDYYILNEDRSVSALDDPSEWAKAFEARADRRVAATELEGAWVSTVFLGLDHAFGDGGPPKIFETMVFPSPEDMDEVLCWRYSTWDEAKAGHEALVQLVSRHLSEGRLLRELDAEQP